MTWKRWLCGRTGRLNEPTKSQRELHARWQKRLTKRMRQRRLAR
jgi:hypothetical protein